MKLCECGCGQPTLPAVKTQGEHKKGEFQRFLHHHRKKGKPTYLTHGCTYTPEYRVYRCAKQRCTNPKNSVYAYYGGRGIKFQFKSFEEFLNELGPRPQGLEIDRIDNDGDYAPGNVRWVTHQQNLSNRRQYKKKEVNIGEESCNS